jgi:hypothetical protein
MSLQTNIIQLWNDSQHYNTAYPWGGGLINIAYYDNRKLFFQPGKIHLSRVPEITLKNSLRIDSPCLLHFQYVNQEKMLAKQRFYRVLELVELKLNKALKINFKYHVTKEKTKLQPINPRWLKKFLSSGVDLLNFPLNPKIFWQDLYVLDKFKNLGPEKFRWLDIWDTNWEQKRQICLAEISSSSEASPEKKSEYSIPEYVINDPRSILIKFYHHSLQPLFSHRLLHDLITANTTIYKIYKFFKRHWYKNA